MSVHKGKETDGFRRRLPSWVIFCGAVAYSPSGPALPRTHAVSIGTPSPQAIPLLSHPSASIYRAGPAGTPPSPPQVQSPTIAKMGFPPPAAAPQGSPGGSRRLLPSLWAPPGPQDPSCALQWHLLARALLVAKGLHRCLGLLPSPGSKRGVLFCLAEKPDP